jgi:hypothetical protein
MFTSSDMKLVKESIHLLGEIVKTTAISGFNWLYKSAVDFSETEFFQNKVSSVIFAYSRYQTNIYLYTKYLYQEYYAVRVIIDSSLFLSETIKNLTLRKRIEPPDNWVQVCSITKLTRGYHIGDGSPIYRESYSLGVDDADFELHFQTAYKHNRELKEDNSAYEYCDTVIVAKSDAKYRVSRCDDVTEKAVFPLKIANSQFLSVEYFATLESIPLVLQIPKNMYMVNNELFSPGFVRRALVYQDEPFDFDLGYRLKIMDSDFKQFEIDRTQYILLGESSYSVENI